MTTETTTETQLWQVYGIVSATAVPPAELMADGAMRLVRHGAVAALVGGPLRRPPRAGRAALLQHAGVLDRLAVTTTVLPARFGAVLDGDERIHQMLTAQEQDFQAALEVLHGRVQYTVKVQHVREMVLQEILVARPEVAALRDLLSDETSGAGYYEQIRLGELVAQGLAATCEADALLLWEALTPHAAAAVPRTITTPEAPFGGAFLVDNDQRAFFEAAAEQVALGWQGRARVRLLGPLAPYDFVTSVPDPAVPGR